MRKDRTIGILIAVCIVATVVAVLWLSPAAKTADLGTTKVEVRTSPVPVVSGLVNRIVTETVDPDLSRGTLEEIYVKKGDAIEQGTPLFRFTMDDSEIRLAEYDVNNLKNEIQRMEKEQQPTQDSKQTTLGLRESEGNIETVNPLTNDSPTSLENLKQQLKRSELQLQILREKQSKLVQKSNVSGVVSNIDSKTHSISIQRESTPVVYAKIPESLRNNIAINTEVEITFPSTPDRAWKGKITALGTVPLTEEGNNDISYYEGVVQLDEAGDLLDGFHVDIMLGKTTQSIWVPKSSIHNTHVWIVKGKTAVPKKVVTGVEDGKAQNIIEGLKDGDVIIMNPDPSWDEKKEVTLP